MSPLTYIRTHYAVPAKRGGRIMYTDSKGVKTPGVITGAHGPHLRIRLDGQKVVKCYHPTDGIAYL